MFIGTIRYNIDPLGLYTDEQIWQVLKEVKLHDAIQGYPNKLDT